MPHFPKTVETLILSTSDPCINFCTMLQLAVHDLSSQLGCCILVVEYVYSIHEETWEKFDMCKFSVDLFQRIKQNGYKKKHNCCSAKRSYLAYSAKTREVTLQRETDYRHSM